jgi:hypothetical protein
MTLPKRGVEGRAFPKFFVLVTRCASFSAKLDAEVSIMHPRSSAVVACAVCILLSTALAFCSRERRDENELRPYTPLASGAMPSEASQSRRMHGTLG